MTNVLPNSVGNWDCCNINVVNPISLRNSKTYSSIRFVAFAPTSGRSMPTARRISEKPRASEPVETDQFC